MDSQTAKHYKFDSESGKFVKNTTVRASVKRFRSNLERLEKSLEPGGMYITRFTGMDDLILALKTSHWKQSDCELPDTVWGEYLPDSNIIKYAKDNKLVIIGLMQSAETNDYEPTMTMVSAE